jgi:flavin reductase (DIM6/NTAB) family NADH-FMN oxidoreductase RutF
VLAEYQKALSDYFAGRPIGEANIGFIDRAGTTLLDGALAHFVVKVFRIHPAGDHTLYSAVWSISSTVRTSRCCSMREVLSAITH